MTLIVGVVVKSYSSSKVDPEIVDDECAKFEALLDRLDTTRAECGIITSVLLLCATRFSGNIKSTFHSKPKIREQIFASDHYKHINEVFVNGVA
ncbi:hypothetical protein PC129_g12046 [Phytophthora cactorum]|nr:hypothetical protein Pcac1_g23947 [Phytophthora cactorum]KAG3217113.1 hypothetical protein PC129_g12046 [Phytophthora cactorum]RAW31442.1 hypothetical protein PC110_g12224 [Phytophthora cactorum]